MERVEIDTNHFLGNFPESCEIHALYATEELDWDSGLHNSSKWSLILPRTKLGPHRQHYFELDNVEGKTYTHVKVTIHPDGGLKRVRVIGRKVRSVLPPSSVVASEATVTSSPRSTRQSQIITVPVLPITPEAFAPFGQVIQAYVSRPESIKVTPANGGTASKFHKLSLLDSSYPVDAEATTGISVYRCQPLKDISEGVTILKTLERHPFTSQAFIPMGRGAGEGLADSGDRYLVVVAHNGSDDKPDMKSLKAFIATAAQGISYNTGIWRKSLLPLLVQSLLISFLNFLDQPMTVLEKVSTNCNHWISAYSSDFSFRVLTSPA